MAPHRFNLERPTDVRIGWRTIGVRPARITAIGDIMADVVMEEAEEVDTVVGISINGIALHTKLLKHSMLKLQFTEMSMASQVQAHFRTNTVKSEAERRS